MTKGPARGMKTKKKDLRFALRILQGAICPCHLSNKDGLVVQGNAHTAHPPEGVRAALVVILRQRLLRRRRTDEKKNRQMERKEEEKRIERECV